MLAGYPGGGFDVIFNKITTGFLMEQMNLGTYL